MGLVGADIDDPCADGAVVDGASHEQSTVGAEHDKVEVAGQECDRVAQAGECARVEELHFAGPRGQRQKSSVGAERCSRRAGEVRAFAWAGDRESTERLEVGGAENDRGVISADGDEQ